eukprot:CAMPEP_0172705980 /NCGR_PEP_ID=MMETSP1074-20121228/45721_1 /TAXON_ID=2916 /ORGANISM="Ceratium fusus, Strain PA161109" /LENGTH=34 /DNA_ID= /DNA_START= /DNA_END= /DNA_ORIENTATION=
MTHWVGRQAVYTNTRHGSSGFTSSAGLAAAAASA